MYILFADVSVIQSKLANIQGSIIILKLSGSYHSFILHILGQATTYQATKILIKESLPALNLETVCWRNMFKTVNGLNPGVIS